MLSRNTIAVIEASHIYFQYNRCTLRLRKMYRLAFILLTVAVTFGTALEHYDQFKEGTCSAYPVRGIKASRKFIDSLKYISAGSKYHMYRTASSRPNYSSMSEYDFTNDACYSRNTTTSIWDSVGAVFGFGGRVLNSFRVVTRPGLYFEGVPRHPLTNTVGVRGTITLTDNKSFAFGVVCWYGAALEQRGWDVLTNTRNIDRKTRKVIEEHAASLGFKRENFVFLNYDRCHYQNPIIDFDIPNYGQRKIDPY